MVHGLFRGGAFSRESLRLAPMPPAMKKEADGSLTLYVQKSQPRRGHGSKLASVAG